MYRSRYKLAKPTPYPIELVTKLGIIIEAGTKVGPDQLGPPVRVGSTRIDSDLLGSNKKNKNKIKLDSDQLGS